MIPPRLEDDKLARRSLPETAAHQELAGGCFRRYWLETKST
jgi:hypothetical protein